MFILVNWFVFFNIWFFCSGRMCVHKIILYMRGHLMMHFHLLLYFIYVQYARFNFNAVSYVVLHCSALRCNSLLTFCKGGRQCEWTLPVVDVMCFCLHKIRDWFTSGKNSILQRQNEHRKRKYARAHKVNVISCIKLTYIGRYMGLMVRRRRRGDRKNIFMY